MLPTLAVPAALLGLGLLALPILVHMLVRDRAPLVRLPTLRFLQGEPPVALRRSRPDEPLLLALRLLILVVAVVALGQGSQQTVLENISSIGTNTINVYPGTGFGDTRADRITTLVVSDADALATQPFVAAVTPTVTANATLRYAAEEASAQITGVGAQYFDAAGVTLLSGRVFGQEAVAAGVCAPACTGTTIAANTRSRAVRGVCARSARSSSVVRMVPTASPRKPSASAARKTATRLRVRKRIVALSLQDPGAGTGQPDQFNALLVHFRRRCSSSRGMISTKLQGMWR